MATTVDVVFDMETQDPDDFLCLIFLASHPRVRLKAVTLVPGSPEQVGLVRWALSILGLSESVAVGAGDIGHATAGSVSPWHAKAFFENGDIPPSTAAEEAWLVLLREVDAQTVLFTGGPLTNVAAAIAHADATGEAFVAGCWLAQGGFAGDNIVPPEHRLDKFNGRLSCQTFNFQSDLPAARAALKHPGFRRRRLVSKNVCHSESNRFGPAQLDQLLETLRSRGDLPSLAASSRLSACDVQQQRLLNDRLRREGSGSGDPAAAAVKYSTLGIVRGWGSFTWACSSTSAATPRASCSTTLSRPPVSSVAMSSPSGVR